MEQRVRRRTRFLLPVVLLLGILWALLSAPAPQATAQTGRAEIRGVWLTGNDMATVRDRPRMEAAVARLKDTNFNTLYPVVWNGGYAYYPSEVTQRRQIQSFTYRGLQQQDILEELIAEAHANGMLVLPWFEFGFMAPPFSELATRHPDWLTQKLDGGRTSVSAAGEVVWLNPFHPEVQAFITELVMEIVNGYDGDGIQFDDHMTLPSTFGYDPYTRDLYRREMKRDPPANPQDPGWLKWRADRITAFMDQLHRTISAAKPNTIVSVSPNYYDFAYKFQLQDWLTWVRRGLVDELLVQVYRPDLESFEAQLTRPELAETRAKIPTAIGVMTGQRTRPVPMAMIEAQTRAARQRGLGVAYFYFESLWQKTAEPAELRQAGFRALFPTPAPRPRP